MAADNLLKCWAIWVDGIGKVGNAQSYTPPSLEIDSLDFRAGDMDCPGPVDGGMSVMEITFALYGVDPEILPLFGLRSGAKCPIIVRSAYNNLQGGVTSMIEHCNGMITTIERDAQDTGSQREKVITVTMKLDYYRASFDGRDLIEIDPVNGVRKLDGMDVLGEVYTALQYR